MNNRSRSLLLSLFSILIVTGTGETGHQFEALFFNDLETAGQNQDMSINGFERSDGLSWYELANHTHSEYSHDSETPVWLLIWSAGSHGAKSICITDHRDCESQMDQNFRKINGCTPIGGEEWGSGDCHIGLFNLEYGDPMVGWTVEEMIPEALARGATIIVNHPFGGTEWSYYPMLHDGIRGIEVWNGPWAWIDNHSAVTWWHEILCEGRIVIGIGGSDVHYFPLNPLLPCNYVLAESDDPDDIQDAVEGGRISISANENKVKCFLWCDTDLNGEFETAIGDNIIVQEPKFIRFGIEVYNGTGMKLTLFTSDEKVHSTVVGDGDPWIQKITAQVGPGTRDFLRLELRKGLFQLMYAMTNPILVNYQPPE